VRPQIIDGLRECVAQEVLPHSVGDGLVQKRRLKNQLAQLRSPVAIRKVAAFADFRAIDKGPETRIATGRCAARSR